MKHKFVISVRKEYENRENGLKANILWVILRESDKNRYSYKEYSKLAQEVEEKVQYKELSEYTFDYLGESYSFKVDSLCPILGGDSYIISEWDLKVIEEVSNKRSYIGRRKSCVEEYDESIKNNIIDKEWRKEGFYPTTQEETEGGWNIRYITKDNNEVRQMFTKFNPTGE